MRSLVLGDRRAVFFLGAAVACFVLSNFAEDYTRVAIGLGIVYVLLSVASWLDHRSREQSIDQRRRPEGRTVRRAGRPSAPE